MEDWITVDLGGVGCRLRQWEDFSWLQGYGTVLQVWDQLFSGQVWFGVEGPYGRLLIKYAGAWTLNGALRPADAMRALQNLTALYGMGHPSLLPLLNHGNAGAGYAALFPWPEALTLSQSLDRARRLSLARQLKMLDGVYDLHGRLSENGCVSVNFSGDSLLMDYENDRALVWDIDLYRRKPAFNDRGRMWGSSAFLSPEEYVLGAPLDESTVAYHMGALAFELFGDNADRLISSWRGPRNLYPVAERACRERKEERYPSVRAFLDAWRETVGRLFR